MAANGEASKRERARDENRMERVTIRFPVKQLEVIEEQAEAGLYKNRSAAIRDAVREKFQEQDTDENEDRARPLGRKATRRRR